MVVLISLDQMLSFFLAMKSVKHFFVFLSRVFFRKPYALEIYSARVPIKPQQLSGLGGTGTVVNPFEEEWVVEERLQGMLRDERLI